MSSLKLIELARLKFDHAAFINAPELFALSPLDGRYAKKLTSLRDYFSEFGWIRYRVIVELAWYQMLSSHDHLSDVCPLSDDQRQLFEDIVQNFDRLDALSVKKIEQRTNHDVKAVEIWLRERLANSDINLELIHFACTSEDINNVAHALILEEARKIILLPALQALYEMLEDLSQRHADISMLSRTHGQPASPTTLGKEVSNMAHRLRTAMRRFSAVRLTAKFNGAVGNYNAHTFACPDIDWIAFSARFIESFGLSPNSHTAQTEPHDGMAEYFDAIAAINTILIDVNRDFWMYISLNYFNLKLKPQEVGSSTMPHKVNPIDFENAEGNLGVANALFRHMADKLPISRLQRDLSDSTVLRNMGVALGHSLLAWQSSLAGIAKLETNTPQISADVDHCWEVLAEALQTVMRRQGIDSPYDQLKELTRGKSISRKALHEFIQQQPLPETQKQRLLQLTPATYTGQAHKLARMKRE